MDTLRVAVVGCGGIANGKHMPALKKIPGVEMVAFCDLIEERAEKAAKNYGAEGAKVYTDYRRLLEDTSIHTVHVCTPNRSHSFISVDALEAGKHVLCEKPMAKSYEDAKLMLDTAKRTGKLLSVAYQNRYRADSQFLKKACQTGELGEIYYAKAHAVRRRGVPTWGVFLNEYEQGGGPLIDIGTHALDLTLWCMDNYKPKTVMGSVFRKLVNEPEKGNPWGDWTSETFTVEDSAFGFVSMENGATVVIESSWALNTLDTGEAITTLCGTKAGADMRDGLRINGVKFNKQYTLKPELSAGGAAYYEGLSDTPDINEAITFVRAVKEGTPLTVLPEQAIVVTQILEAIYTSAKTGKPVNL